MREEETSFNLVWFVSFIEPKEMEMTNVFPVEKYKKSKSEKKEPYQ